MLQIHQINKTKGHGGKFNYQDADNVPHEVLWHTRYRGFISESSLPNILQENGHCKIKHPVCIYLPSTLSLSVILDIPYRMV